ncbi:hypothetical protein BSKO_00874 [Bryopsis sp. KO-2023]|nr:hypothetical protein BSKO_00874 [Bryopsis sp. KO-2023]
MAALPSKTSSLDIYVDDNMESSDSPKAENWEMVDATNGSEPGSTVKSVVGSEDSIGSDSEKGKFLGDSQEFQFVHAKAVAQIEEAQQVLQDTAPLPVSTELHASDVQIISDESLSGFSSPGKSVCPEGSAEFGDVPEEERCQNNKAGTSELQETYGGFVGQKETLGEASVAEKQVKTLHEPQVETRYDASAKTVGGVEPLNKKEEAPSTGLFRWLLRQWTALIRDWPLKGILGLYLRPLQAIFGERDWRGLARNAGVAMLSAMVLGLFVRNRKLAHELKRKHEEVTRLMVTLMNFQELWNSNRSNGPVLRHTGIALQRPC